MVGAFCLFLINLYTIFKIYLCWAASSQYFISLYGKQAIEQPYHTLSHPFLYSLCPLWIRLL